MKRAVFQWWRYTEPAGSEPIMLAKKFKTPRAAEQWLLARYPALKFKRDQTVFGGHYYDPITFDAWELH